MISYHVGQTYANQVAQQREAYYEPSVVVPFAIFDGTNVVWEGNPTAYEDVYTEAFTIARTVTPLFNITITDPVTSVTQANFKLELVPTDTLPDDEVCAFIAICEDSLPGAYTTFMHLCRGLQEIPLSIAYPDTMNESVIFSHTIEAQRLSAVVFIQDVDTKEILQSAMTRFQEE
ncbi:hypothetical protein JXB22_02760 [candidate division WOR-3 bacterium]|nr:hypothetical protein [candidate division WOR-3 bacterium]